MDYFDKKQVKSEVSESSKSSVREGKRVGGGGMVSK